MKKYYRIFRIDMPSVKIRDDRRDEYSTYHTSESCLVKDGCDTYESEEEAEKMLNGYFENFPYKARNEEYVIVKCYKMEE